MAYLRATGRKRPYLDPNVLLARIAEERKSVTADPPRRLTLRGSVVCEEVAGMRVYVYRPRDASAKKGHVVYLHGGSYVFEISPEHHRFCAELARAVGCQVSVPIYPLAPESTALQTQGALRAVLHALGPIDALAGDSAGAGLALALAQQLTKPPPVLLLSPWLDAAVAGDRAALDRVDPWLSPAGLREAGRLYAGNLDPSDPRVSPLHGPIDAIPELATLIGTRDLFLPDARALKIRAPEMTLREYDGMVHDFMLIRALPEAKRAFREVCGILSAMVRRGASGTR